jgi:glycosyltransferase involved in cell wall biosynthesis
LTALEALASGCPAVLSPDATEEETAGEGYLIAHSFDEYVTFCRQLLENEKFRSKMGSLGRNVVIREYDKKQQFDLYQKAIARFFNEQKSKKRKNVTLSER